MTLMRKHSVDQMKRIEREIVKQGGTLDKTNPAEKKMANNLFMHDPFEADSKGVRKIATAEEFFKNDIPDAKTSVKMKKENMKHINESKIADAIQDAIEQYYVDDNFDSAEKLRDLLGLPISIIVEILEKSTPENAMENLMEVQNESKVLKFEMFCESEKFNFEEKEDIFEYLSKNFQKITVELQKLQKNDERIINHFTNEINNLIIKNNLKK